MSGSWVGVSFANDHHELFLMFFREQLTQVFYNSIQQLQTLVIQRAEIIKLQVALPNSQAFVTHQILTKHIRRFGKFYLRLASVDHKRLAELPNCSDMVMFYWTQIVEAAKNLPKIEGMYNPLPIWSPCL